VPSDTTHPGRPLLFNVNVIFFSQIANYTLQFLLTILIARGLGAAARGDYALFVLSTTLAASVGTLGMGLGSIYYLGKAKYSLRTLLGNSQLLVLVLGTLASAALLVAGFVTEPKGFVEGGSYWLYLLAFPAVLEYLLLTAILLGEDRIVSLNVAMLSQTVIVLVGAGVLAVTGGLTIFPILAVWSVSFVVASAIALAFIGFENWSVRAVLKPDRAALTDQIKLGLPGQAGNIMQHLNYRFDQFVVRALRTRAELGVYSVAVGLSESVWWIANAVSLALLPRLTRIGSERSAETTPVICRNVLLLSAIAAGSLAALATVAVAPVFGSEFSAMPGAMVLLMPGIVALSGTKVLASYIFSEGKVILNSIAALLTLGVTITLDFVLIPQYGINGAAAASSIAYAASLAFILYFYRRLSSGNILECLVPQPRDAQLYLNLGRRLIDRVASARSAK
jgi:O-antigen/teichoic acid export membrane protein